MKKDALVNEEDGGSFLVRGPKMIPDDDRLPRNLELAKDEDEMAAILFERLSKMFTQSMILRTRANQARVWKYDRNWKAPKANESIFLDTTSPFRIVSRSKAPYHGPIHPNPVTSKFFEQWHIPAPEHVSIAPLFNGEEIYAFIFCIGKKEAYRPEILADLEKYRDEFQFALQKKGFFKAAS